MIMVDLNFIICISLLTLLLKITGPDGKLIYNGERESNGRYTFAAHLDGEYKYCFSNRMSTVTPKEVMFSVDVAVPPEHQPGASAGAAGAGVPPPASTHFLCLLLVQQPNALF